MIGDPPLKERMRAGCLNCGSQAVSHDQSVAGGIQTGGDNRVNPEAAGICCFAVDISNHIFQLPPKP